MYSLTELNLSNFDTSKVTNMGGMFSKCSKIVSLDLSSFDTSNATPFSIADTVNESIILSGILQKFLLVKLVLSKSCVFVSWSSIIL